jgi:hypothetical protein
MALPPSTQATSSLCFSVAVSHKHVLRKPDANGFSFVAEVYLSGSINGEAITLRQRVFTVPIPYRTVTLVSGLEGLF